MITSSKAVLRQKLVLISYFVLTVGFCTAATAQDETYVDNYRTWSLSGYENERGETLSSFNEAPSLAAQVEAGTLPPVEDRLPVREDILVVQPRDEVGRYGGEISFNATNPESFGNTGYTAWDQRLTGLTTNWETLFPNLAKAVELSEDAMSATVTLREGMRWSDGEPVTTDDVMFWYEDIMLNEELPNLPSQLVFGGQPVSIERIDDYTVTFSFPSPNPGFLVDLALTAAGFPLAPKHYLQQFLPQYNEDAEQLAESAGFDTWVDYFTDRYTGQIAEQSNPDLPVLKPWTLESTDQFGNKFYRRNPYYWKVDTEGNQLPYIDAQTRLLLSDPQVVILNVQAGKVDYGYYNLEVTDLPVLKAGENGGNYTTLLWPAAQGAMNQYAFNITVNDPVLNEIFNDVRFRQAMSLAIDREEINETLYFGLAKVRQWGVPSSSALYEDWMGSHYADYDPEQANQLLDDMGLERGPNGTRMRPDGKPLTIILWDAINRANLDELVGGYWEALGVNVQINPSTREAFQQALLSNEVQADVWFADLTNDLQMYRQPIWLRPPYGIDSTPVGGGLSWRQWWLTNGEEGSEPPEYYREQMERVDNWQNTTYGSQEWIELGKEAVGSTVEQMLHIGTVGEAPEVFIRSNRLHNFPREEGTLYLNHLVGGHADQWFVDNE